MDEIGWMDGIKWMDEWDGWMDAMFQ